MSDKKSTTNIGQVLKRLEQSEDAASLVGLAFDFAASQPLSRYVDVMSLMSHLEGSLEQSLARRIGEMHVLPFFERELERAGSRQDLLKDWLSESSSSRMRQLVGRPIRLERRFLERLVEQPAVRHMLRSIIQDALSRFVDSLKPSQSGGGILSSVGRGAFGVAKLGVFGKISGQLQAALSKAAQSFIESSMDAMLRHTVELMSSPETAERMGEMAQVGFDGALSLSTQDLFSAAQRLPLADLTAMSVETLYFNLARAEVRRVVRAEVEAALQLEGSKSLDELLEEGGMRQYLRDQVVQRVTPIVIEFAHGEAFSKWLAEG